MGIDLTFCELREKEVVNMIDGRRLGRILDICFTANGSIVGIVVPGERRFFKNITGSESLFIAWRNIKKIGCDAILVELSGCGEGGGGRPPGGGGGGHGGGGGGSHCCGSDGFDGSYSTEYYRRIDSDK